MKVLFLGKPYLSGVLMLNTLDIEGMCFQDICLAEQAIKDVEECCCKDWVFLCNPLQIDPKEEVLRIMRLAKERGLIVVVLSCNDPLFMYQYPNFFKEEFPLCDSRNMDTLRTLLGVLPIPG